MIHHFGADLWYLLGISKGIGHMILFAVAMIWVRLLLQVVEDAIAPLRKHPHKFVYPFPSPFERRTFGQSGKSVQSVTALESGSEINQRKIGA